MDGSEIAEFPSSPYRGAAHSSLDVGHEIISSTSKQPEYSFKHLFD